MSGSSGSAIEAPERRLLDAILAAPAAEGPRLVYADWLQLQQTQTNVHGELIVAQCELAHARREPESAEARARIERLEAIEAELLDRPEHAWMKPFIELASRSFGGTMKPARGFMSTTAMASRPEELRRWHLHLERYAPFISRMRVIDATLAKLEQLLATGILHRFSTLELHAANVSEENNESVESPPLERLRKLEFTGFYFVSGGLERLLAPGVPALETLRFEECIIHDDSLTRLVAVAPPKLRSVRIKRGGYILDTELAQLTKLDLRELRIEGGRVSADVARELRRAIPRCVIRNAPMQVVG